METYKNFHKTKTIKIKRLFHGQASIRDYVLNGIIQRNLDLIIQCGNEKMFIPNSQIFKKGRHTNLNIVSKYNNRTYSLVDIPFKPNQTNPNQPSLFGGVV